MPLAPEVLALVLADMLLLWTLKPPAEGSGVQSLPLNLSGLGQLLSQPGAFKESYNLLLDLLVSFSAAVKGMEITKSIPITLFLNGAQCFTGGSSPNKELKAYWKKRLVGKSHDEAGGVKVSDYGTFVDDFRSL